MTLFRPRSFGLGHEGTTIALFNFSLGVIADLNGRLFIASVTSCTLRIEKKRERKAGERNKANKRKNRRGYAVSTTRCAVQAFPKHHPIQARVRIIIMMLTHTQAGRQARLQVPSPHSHIPCNYDPSYVFIAKTRWTSNARNGSHGHGVKMGGLNLNIGNPVEEAGRLHAASKVR